MREQFEVSSQETSREAMTKINPAIFLVGTLSK